MQLSDWDYVLPPQLIAQTPIEPRDHARLLVAQRSDDTIQHQHFYNCIEWLEPGDVLVVNDSKVIPARLFGQKTTGGKVELLLLQQKTTTQWECLIGGTRPRPGQTINLTDTVTAVIRAAQTNFTWLVEFSTADILALGHVPLPPYITQKTPLERYQTVYAAQAGSAAAPTAGLHFTPALLERLTAKGIIIAPLTLHVGLGTFAPIRSNSITDHVMHREFAILPPTTAQAITQAKQAGHKIVAVGTTSVRTLEAFAGQATSGWIDIFITPGYQFKVVDAMITNFHLPKTTLLLLVAAFMGKQFMEQAYQTAIAEQYRFYSFGDAMLII